MKLNNEIVSPLELSSSKDRYIKAGENAQLVLSYLNDVFPGLVSRYELPDGGQNIPPYGYFLFKINHFVTILSITDFTNNSNLKLEVEYFIHSNEDEINKIFNTGLTCKHVKKVLGKHFEVNKLLEDGKTYIKVNTEKYISNNISLPEDRMNYDSDDINRINSSLNKSVRKLHKSINQKNEFMIYINHDNSINIKKRG